MQTVYSILSWYEQQENFPKVFIFIMFWTAVYLILKLVFAILSFLIGLIQGLFRKNSKPGDILTHEQLAERQFGKLPDKMFVFMYDIKTGEMKQQINIKRYLSKKEYDSNVLCQIGAINKTVADLRFKQWKQAWLTTQKA